MFFFFIIIIENRSWFILTTENHDRRVNPVETIYASFPAFLYLNTSLAGNLLESLLEVQAANDKSYAAPDLGV